MKKIELTLVGLKEELPRHWEVAFRGLPVEIVTGNLFDLQADAVVSPANSFGIMDGGWWMVDGGWWMVDWMENSEISSEWISRRGCGRK